MAKFAELTLAGNHRVLVNPEQVANFTSYGGEVPSGTRITLAGNLYPFTVQEAPDEVLRRLCSPAMPDPIRDESPVPELLHDIAVYRRKTEEAEYTDTGEAWELLDDIEDRLKSLL